MCVVSCIQVVSQTDAKTCPVLMSADSRCCQAFSGPNIWSTTGLSWLVKGPQMRLLWPMPFLCARVLCSLWGACSKGVHPELQLRVEGHQQGVKAIALPAAALPLPPIFSARLPGNVELPL